MEYDSRPITPSFSSSGLAAAAVVVPQEDSSSNSGAPSSTSKHMVSEQRHDTCVTPTKEVPYLVHQDSPASAVCGSGGICDPSVLAEVLFPVFYRSGTVNSPQDAPHGTQLCYKGGVVSGAVLMDDPARISPDHCQKRGRFLVWPAVPASVTTRVLDTSTASS